MSCLFFLASLISKLTILMLRWSPLQCALQRMLNSLLLRQDYRMPLDHNVETNYLLPDTQRSFEPLGLTWSILSLFIIRF